ncbi:hypothetical protein [Actinokineospora sp. NPDC004072]
MRQRTEDLAAGPLRAVATWAAAELVDWESVGGGGRMKQRAQELAKGPLRAVGARSGAELFQRKATVELVGVAVA